MQVVNGRKRLRRYAPYVMSVVWFDASTLDIAFSDPHSVADIAIQKILTCKILKMDLERSPQHMFS